VAPHQENSKISLSINMILMEINGELDLATNCYYLSRRLTDLSPQSEELLFL
jgi:hypothetical protein